MLFKLIKLCYLMGAPLQAAYGLSVLGPATKTITKALKNAGVGANYSPVTHTLTCIVRRMFCMVLNILT